MNSGMHSEEAQRVANWDPFDQNASACWFDGEYMFGNAVGFDVVVGNPPYVQLQKDEGETGKPLQGRWLRDLCAQG